MGEATNLVVRPASPALASLIHAIGYYQGEFAHARERALPTGGTQLLVNLAADRMWWHPDGTPEPRTVPGAVWQGPDTRPAIINSADQREIIWVSFRPGGAYPFLPTPTAAVRDQLIPLADLWGRDGATLRERLLSLGSPAHRLRAVEGALLARAVRPLTPDPAVTVAAAALQQGATVTEVGDRLGWTRRRLARRFEDQLGVTPKRFARVRRFQRLLGAVTAGDGHPDWARLAVEHGYHDQAHMIHDFQEFAGFTPTAYRPRSPDAQNHVPV